MRYATSSARQPPDGPTSGEQRREHVGDELFALVGAAFADEMADLLPGAGDLEASDSDGGQGEHEPHEPPRWPDDGQAEYIPDAQPPAGGGTSSGMTEAERVNSFRAACLQHECEGWSTERICATMQFERVEIPWSLRQAGPAIASWDTMGRTVGFLKLTFMGQTVEALCQNPYHSSPKCSLLLNTNGDIKATEARCFRWVIHWIGINRAAHQASRDAIRTEHRLARASASSR